MEGRGAEQWQGRKVRQVNKRLSMCISTVPKGLINLLSSYMAEGMQNPPDCTVAMTKLRECEKVKMFLLGI